MNNNQSNLFLIVKESANLVAYPVVVMFPQDETGSRYITFMPLRNVRDKTPIAISIVHRINLHYFGDNIEIKDVELPFNDENSLLVSLCNMLVGPRYQYIQGADTQYEQQYICFVESFCHLLQQLLKEKPSQKAFLNKVYSMIQQSLFIFNISQSELVEFMEIIDEIIEATIDDSGIITSESVEAARQYLNSDSETVDAPKSDNEKTEWADTDAQFFSNLNLL